MLEILKKETPTQVFSSEYCKTFKNTFLEKHPRPAASDSSLECTEKKLKKNMTSTDKVSHAGKPQYFEKNCRYTQSQSCVIGNHIRHVMRDSKSWGTANYLRRSY